VTRILVGSLRANHAALVSRRVRIERPGASSVTFRNSGKLRDVARAAEAAERWVERARDVQRRLAADVPQLEEEQARSKTTSSRTSSGCGSAEDIASHARRDLRRLQPLPP